MLVIVFGTHGWTTSEESTRIFIQVFSQTLFPKQVNEVVAFYSITQATGHQLSHVFWKMIFLDPLGIDTSAHRAQVFCSAKSSTRRKTSRLHKLASLSSQYAHSLLLARLIVFDILTHMYAFATPSKKIEEKIEFVVNPC